MLHMLIIDHLHPLFYWACIVVLVTMIENLAIQVCYQHILDQIQSEPSQGANLWKLYQALTKVLL